MSSCRTRKRALHVYSLGVAAVLLLLLLLQLCIGSWRVLCSSCMRSLMTIGSEIKKALVLWKYNSKRSWPLRTHFWVKKSAKTDSCEQNMKEAHVMNRWCSSCVVQYIWSYLYWRKQLQQLDLIVILNHMLYTIWQNCNTGAVTRDAGCPVIVGDSALKYKTISRPEISRDWWSHATFYSAACIWSSWLLQQIHSAACWLCRPSGSAGLCYSGASQRRFLPAR